MGVPRDSRIRQNLRVWGLSSTTRGWDIRDLDGLKRELDEHQPDVVWIDSLKAAMAEGHLLEDISKPVVRTYMDAVHAVGLQSAALGWVHHANKGNEIADNEAIQECPDTIYLLSKTEDGTCSLQAKKTRGFPGHHLQYRLEEDFLDLVPLQATTRADTGAVLKDCIHYICQQNASGIEPAASVITAGLAPKGHSPEAIKSCLRRNTGPREVFSKRRNPNDQRQAIYSMNPEN